MSNKEIREYFEIADKLAIEEVERLARNVLRDNPKKVNSFLMSMGSWFFIDNNGDVIHDCERNNIKMLHKLKGYDTLYNFISEWDDIFHLTGESMRFTADGEKITNW